MQEEIGPLPLPANSVVLNGSGTDFRRKYCRLFPGTKVSGGAANPGQRQLRLTLRPPVWRQARTLFRLTVTDNHGRPRQSDNAKPLRSILLPTFPPLPTQEEVKTITLPANSVVLNGSGTDSDGSIASYSWTKIFRWSGNNDQCQYGQPHSIRFGSWNLHL